LTIWLPTTKSQELPQFPCVQVVCHITLNFFYDGDNFASQLISIRYLNAKLWAPKVAKVLDVGISKLPLGSPGTKWHLGAGPMAKHKVYYKGEGGGFPQVRAMVNLMSPCLPVARLCTKVLQLRTNQLTVWFVQVCVGNWCLSLFLPISKFQHAPLPLKCYELRSISQLLIFSLFLFQTHIWIYQGAWGASTYLTIDKFKGGTWFLTSTKQRPFIFDQRIIVTWIAEFFTLEFNNTFTIGIINVYGFNSTCPKARL
jgi:hypothetical protein